MVTVRAPSFVVRRVCIFIFLGVMGYSIFQMTRSNSYYDMSDRNIMLYVKVIISIMLFKIVKNTIIIKLLQRIICNI